MKKSQMRSIDWNLNLGLVRYVEFVSSISKTVGSSVDLLGDCEEIVLVSITIYASLIPIPTGRS